MLNVPINIQLVLILYKIRIEGLIWSGLGLCWSDYWIRCMILGVLCKLVQWCDLTHVTKNDPWLVSTQPMWSSAAQLLSTDATQPGLRGTAQPVWLGTRRVGEIDSSSSNVKHGRKWHSFFTHVSDHHMLSNALNAIYCKFIDSKE